MTLAASPAQSSATGIRNSLLATLFFLATEAMMFIGLVGSFLVIRARYVDWPPVGQPRLPLALSSVNTLVLLASGALLVLARRAFYDEPVRSRSLCIASTLLAAIFLGVQGFEWIRLLGFGLTMQSSLYGSIFYLTVGLHALHAFIGVGLLVSIVVRFSKLSQFDAILAYWLFVVGIWPLLYGVLYFA